jgi:hypothetical protein
VGVHAYAAALRSGDPAACRALEDPTLRADCLLAVVEGQARAEPEATAALCEEVPEGTWRDECWFQLAERSDQPEHCARAGLFADDCRLHALSSRLPRLLKASAPGEFEQALAPELVDLGFAAEDLRPWSAAYRHALGRQRPLDRGSCAAAPPLGGLDLLTVCRQTALVLLNDRLNRARDSRRVPCDGGPLPPELAFAPDPDLEALLAERKARDLCP